MILIDYNGIAVGNIITQRVELKEDIIRHMILNTIRMYRKKFKQYGDVVITCDGGSWRRDYFPEYKWKRRNTREESDLDWEEIFRIINLVREEIKENFPYKVLHMIGVEADDMIGAIIEQTQEFGQHEDVMIVSADKDFAQLQKFNNVKQYSPMTKKFIEIDNPRMFLFEHVLKGDSSDGVPNVLSGDKTFVDGIRQSPMTKKKIQYYFDNADKLESIMGNEVYRNYKRNKLMIDLADIPEAVKSDIINTYEKSKPAHQSKILNYLIKKRCKMLIECIEDFT